MRKTNAKVAEWHPRPSVFSPRCSSRSYAGIAGGHFESSGSPFFRLEPELYTRAACGRFSPHGAGSPDALPVAYLSFRDHPTAGHEEISGRSQHVGGVRRSPAPIHSHMAQQTHSTARLHTRPGPSEVGWYCTTSFDNYVDPCLLQESMHPVLRVRADIV